MEEIKEIKLTNKILTTNTFTLTINENKTIITQNNTQKELNLEKSKILRITTLTNENNKIRRQYLPS